MRQRPFYLSGLTNRDGAAALEFAIVAPVFFLLIFCALEYGLILFSKVAMESATASASRTASLGGVSSGCSDRVCTLRQLIQQKSLGLINGSAVQITAKLVDATPTQDPDICLTDPPTMPATCDAPLQYQDTNGNGHYDGPGTVSLGNAGDLVEVRASYPWKVQVPMLKYLFGTNGVVMISSSTVIKNEPF